MQESLADGGGPVEEVDGVEGEVEQDDVLDVDVQPMDSLNTGGPPGQRV